MHTNSYYYITFHAENLYFTRKNNKKIKILQYICKNIENEAKNIVFQLTKLPCYDIIDTIIGMSVRRFDTGTEGKKRSENEDIGN